jgi:3-oxoacyl-[acyl-carrier protein] reductase
VQANDDYLLSVADIERYEAAHGRIPKGAWVLMRTDWSKRSDPEAYQNFDETGQHTPGPSTEAVRFLVEQRDVLGFGSEAIGTDAGQGYHLRPPYPVPLLHARRGTLRAAVPEQPRPAAARGRGADLPAAEDREGQRQPAARAGARGSAGMTPKVAAVTGGSAGIGKAICEDLLAQGYEVVSLARRKAEIDHPKLHSLEVDLSDRAATGEAVRELVERFAPTTIVHNAGVIRAALLSEVKLDDLDALVDLHLGCAIQLVQGALPAMRAQRFGRVVLLSSRAALGLATRTSYSATKAGMLGMARTWALELAADGITVNVVAPGPIRTDMFYDVVEAGSEKERALAASVPVKRLGESADVARAVRFFADPDNSFVTGQVLYVCGGTSVGSLAL